MKTTRIIILFALIPVLIVITLLITARQHPTPPLFNPEGTLEITDELVARYLPSTYGLPDTIAGYPVIAVVSSANTECWNQALIMLEIQMPESDIGKYLTSDIDWSIRTAIAAIGRSDLSYGFRGPEVTLESFIRGNEQFNQARREHGCVKFGLGLRNSQFNND